MRKLTSILAVLPLALFLLAPAVMTGCSAHAGVHVDNPDHDSNHFNNSGSHGHDQYTPHEGENYQLPAYR